ncbi:Prefoldin-domain-containing protein [Rhizopus microsporus var. microsporus]|uniref:Prefoldin-domain-containing protein n=1 Tax=Rhizopus microsporus var. microsporus TaxID=86635 RepID=A0A1X0QR06_RHIZD|nr:Prefoldin-domain-containing protein [Rhizopus microsporus var. microsporus]
MTDQISLFNNRLSQQLASLQEEYQRWNNYKTDYDALESLLKTLPDNTTKSAMIPLGKMAFMPGKLVHTNEILVLLGDKYYAERSAKQAIDILSRRREYVQENLNLVEAQLNSLKAKSNSILESGILAENQASIKFNEEGLPIMEIREEWPEDVKEEKEKRKGALVKVSSTELPPSVQRARDMMNQSVKEKSTDENKALFDMLDELEGEEEGEHEEEHVDSKGKPWLKKLNEESDQEEENEENDDDRYDMEISESIFDRLNEENDEEYPLDGIVDQDDFTYYDQETVEDDTYERSTPKLITKPKNKKSEEKKPENKTQPMQEYVAETTQGDLAIAPKQLKDEEEKPKNEKKKMSKFKLMKQQEQSKGKTKEEAWIKNVPTEKTPEEQTSKDKPKKVSKFKSMKQQERGEEKEEKPKKVSWGANTTVIEHENHDAPSVISQTSSYSEPVKNEKDATKMIRSPADIFKVIRQTQEDGYPSLDDDDNGQEGTSDPIDLNELIEAAREKREPYYRTTDTTMIHIPRQINHSDDDDEEEEEEEQGSIIVANKNKLDNKIMKGSVMERDTAPVDMEKLEDDMDLREITSKYHQKRQQLLAATGGFSFEPKPEIEVFEEELPLPREEKEEEEQVVPKKMSRFKAARLGLVKEEHHY